MYLLQKLRVCNSIFNLPYVPLLYHSKADCLCNEVQYQMMGHNFLGKNINNIIEM